MTSAVTHASSATGKSEVPAAATRIDGILKDLALLKAQDEKEYTRLRDALREALK